MNVAEAALFVIGILTCAYGITTISSAFYGAGLIILFMGIVSLVAS